jgi:hypothetical protein
VSLFFADMEEFVYEPSPYRYVPHLSILDVLMWNPPGKVVEALKTKTTLTKAS